MSHYPKLTLSDDEYNLAVAYAADRGLPLASIARSALMSEVTRHAKRSGLLAAMRAWTQECVADALTARSPRGDGESDGGGDGQA